MNPGITRWKIGPLYSGLPRILACEDGLVHSFFPVASPMKLSTVMGALSGNKSQVMLPSVVIKTARVVCGATPVAGAAGVAGLEAVWANIDNVSATQLISIAGLRMNGS